MRHRDRLGFLFVAAACLGIGGCRTVVEAHWEQLAAVSADLNVDHAIIEIHGDGKFRGVKLEAAGADFEMFDIRMTFGSGEVYEPAVRVHFQEGSWSRRIDLPGGHRHIRKIEFWVKGTQPGGQAQVIVWGLR